METLVDKKVSLQIGVQFLRSFVPWEGIPSDWRPGPTGSVPWRNSFRLVFRCHGAQCLGRIPSESRLRPTRLRALKVFFQIGVQVLRGSVP